MKEPPDKIEGPVCKVCGKPMKGHSFADQIRCEKEGKENGFK